LETTNQTTTHERKLNMETPRKENMYTCNRCKKEYDGEPAMKNNAGIFCAECEAERKRRVSESHKQRIKSLNGCCIWCGEKVEKHKIGSDDHMCEPSKRLRDHLLKCIRFSDHAAKYVAAREAIEAPKREARLAAAMAARKEATPEPTPSDAEARLLRMEKMLNKLTAALGGV
jgi:hypothetical protein